MVTAPTPRGSRGEAHNAKVIAAGQDDARPSRSRTSELASSLLGRLAERSAANKGRLNRDESEESTPASVVSTVRCGERASEEDWAART